MADQEHDPQPWGTGLDTNFDFQARDTHSTASAPSSAAPTTGPASSPDYHIAAATSGPDPSPFSNFAANAAWADQNPFTPPRGPSDSDVLDNLLFPDNWNVPAAAFPDQSLQFRPRPGGPDPTVFDPFNPFIQTAGLPVTTGAPVQSVGPFLGAVPNLTAAQQEHLRNIAMPPHLQYQSPKSEPSQLSPQSSNGDGTKALSPDPSKAGSRKRKSSAEEDDLDEDEDEDGQQPVKKTAHNMIEKRYRTNLNDKIAALRDSVPSLRVLSKSARGEDTTEDREELHGLTPAHKLNKATVLSKATEYIRHLEKRNNRLNDENSAMQQRITAFEKLFMASAMNGNIHSIQNQNNAIPFGQNGPQFMNSPVTTPGGLDPQGMIPVPDDMKRIISAQLATGRPYPVQTPGFQQTPAIMRQQQIQQQQQQQMQNNRWQNAPFYGKFMVGSLAGLMFVESLREHEQSSDSPEGRGLYALPIGLLGRLVTESHVSFAGHQYSLAYIISTLKALLLLGTLLWAFVPHMFASQSPKKPKSQLSNAALQAVPSLASPINVRRQAWLTAIQTVWVPRHNFFLEAAALLLKTMKLSLRNTIGIHGYQVLTGLTEERETARVKAWTIALDAQLAGGDVEINKSRLTLTLLASRTLPDTPLRLMLHALHIRVLLWQMGNQSLNNMLAAKLARSKWNEARQLHRLMNSLRRVEPPCPDDELPDHLAILLELDCDEVLNEIVVQRAHNLAFNRPTTYDVDDDVDGMSSVVEDPAVRSPMDAVAAWWSSLVLQRALSASLEVTGDKKDHIKALADFIHVAIKVAPIGSNAQLRGLVAKALILDEKRGAHIAGVLKALGPSLNPDKHPSYSSGVPPLIDAPLSSIAPDPDVQLTLRCAMAIAHLQRFEAPPPSAIAVVDSILPASTEGLSLLGCTAAYQLMNCLHQHPVASKICTRTLERLAGTLRIWIGSSEGDRPGLDHELRQKMVERCITVTKSAIGIDEDQGYVSMSESESSDNVCEIAA